MADEEAVVMADPQSVEGYISNPLGLIKPSWNALKINFGTLVAAALAPVGVIAVAALIGLSAFASRAVGPIANILMFVLGIVAIVLVVMLLPVFPLVLLRSAQGTKISFRDAFEQGRPYILPLIGIGILTGLAIIGGLILFIIPGLIFAAWFSLGFFVLLDENKGVVDSMKRSKELVKGHVWEMWGVLALPSLVGIFNVIPVLGWIVSLVFQVAYLPAQAIRYLQIKEVQGKPTKTHWANYVVALFFPVVLVVTSAIGGLIGNRNQKSLDQQIQEQLNKSQQDSPNNPSIQ